MREQQVSWKCLPIQYAEEEQEEERDHCAKKETGPKQNRGISVLENLQEY